MRVIFTYRGYDGKDHEWTGAWSTSDQNLAILMAGRAFERDVRDMKAIEPMMDHKVTVSQNTGN